MDEKEDEEDNFKKVCDIAQRMTGEVFLFSEPVKKFEDFEIWEKVYFLDNFYRYGYLVDDTYILNMLKIYVNDFEKYLKDNKKE